MVNWEVDRLGWLRELVDEEDNEDDGEGSQEPYRTCDCHCDVYGRQGAAMRPALKHPCQGT